MRLYVVARLLIITALVLVNVGSATAQNRTTFRCEDLRSAGLILVPPSSPDYDPLLADIQRRIDHPSPEVAGYPNSSAASSSGRSLPKNDRLRRSF